MSYHMKWKTLVAAVFGSYLTIGLAMAETTCTITEKFQCAQGQGCQPIESKVVIRINVEKQVYSRCDAKGCDDYQAQFTVSGKFINIAVPANGLLAKLTADGSSFTEVATLGTAVLLSFGSCR
jgi:hypothetical protein